MYLWQWKAASWTYRILFSITFIIGCRICKVEWNKIKLLNGNNSTRKANAFQKRLDMFAMTTLIINTIIPLIAVLHKMPIICKFYLFNINSILWCFSLIGLGYFQISRLQYCFTAKHIHGTRYAYPRWLFVLLYTNGLLVGIFAIFAMGPAYHPIPIGMYGCRAEASTQSVLYTYVLYLWYYMWDWTTLFCYVYKVHQIHHNYKDKSVSDKNMKHTVVLNKVKFILLKVIIVTLLYEINAFIFSVLHLIIHPFEWSGIMGPFIWSMQYLICAYAIVLMLEHNHSKYQKLITILSRMHLCCCCQTLINDVVMNDILSNMLEKQKTNSPEINVIPQNKQEDTMVESVDLPVKMEHSNIHDLSIDTTVYN